MKPRRRARSRRPRRHFGRRQDREGRHRQHIPLVRAGSPSLRKPGSVYGGNSPPPTNGHPFSINSFRLDLFLPDSAPLRPGLLSDTAAAVSIGRLSGVVRRPGWGDTFWKQPMQSRFFPGRRHPDTGQPKDRPRSQKRPLRRSIRAPERSGGEPDPALTALGKWIPGSRPQLGRTLAPNDGYKRQSRTLRSVLDHPVQR